MISVMWIRIDCIKIRFQSGYRSITSKIDFKINPFIFKSSYFFLGSDMKIKFPTKKKLNICWLNSAFPFKYLCIQMNPDPTGSLLNIMRLKIICLNIGIPALSSRVSLERNGVQDAIASRMHSFTLVSREELE